MIGYARRQAQGERGAMSVWMATAMLAFIVAIGIGVDFSGHASMTQDARAVADEAARAGGQRLAVEEGRAHVDVSGALAAANAYMASSPYRGTARVRGGNVVEVEVSARYQCVFLSIIGIDTLPVRAIGAADINPVIHGKRR